MEKFEYKYENREQLKNQVHSKIKEWFVSKKPTVAEYENIMLFLVKQMLPFLETIMSFNGMELVRDLENVFLYIEKHKSDKRPLTELEQYVELCNDAGVICGECEETERYSEEEIIVMQQNWYDEMEEMDEEKNTIAHYAFSMFGAYYYFLCYFAYEEPDLEHAQEFCEDMMEEILFDILWELDFDLKKKEEEASCLKAVKILYERWNLN